MKSKNGFAALGILTVLIAVFMLLGGGWWYINTMRHAEPRQSTTPPPAPAASPTQGVMDTSMWKTYRNEQYGFEVKYPPDFYVFEKNNEFFKRHFRVEFEQRPGEDTFGVFDVFAQCYDVLGKHQPKDITLWGAQGLAATLQPSSVESSEDIQIASVTAKVFDLKGLSGGLDGYAALMPLCQRYTDPIGGNPQYDNCLVVGMQSISDTGTIREMLRSFGLLRDIKDVFLAFPLCPTKG